jgi:hypothetical protein
MGTLSCRVRRAGDARIFQPNHSYLNCQIRNLEHKGTDFKTAFDRSSEIERDLNKIFLVCIKTKSSAASNLVRKNVVADDSVS